MSMSLPDTLASCIKDEVDGYLSETHYIKVSEWVDALVAVAEKQQEVVNKALFFVRIAYLRRNFHPIREQCFFIGDNHV